MLRPPLVRCLRSGPLGVHRPPNLCALQRGRTGRLNPTRWRHSDSWRRAASAGWRPLRRQPLPHPPRANVAAAATTATTDDDAADDAAVVGTDEHAEHAAAEHTGGLRWSQCERGDLLPDGHDDLRCRVSRQHVWAVEPAASQSIDTTRGTAGHTAAADDAAVGRLLCVDAGSFLPIRQHDWDVDLHSEVEGVACQPIRGQRGTSRGRFLRANAVERWNCLWCRHPYQVLPLGVQRCTAGVATTTAAATGHETGNDTGNDTTAGHTTDAAIQNADDAADDDAAAGHTNPDTAWRGMLWSRAVWERWQRVRLWASLRRACLQHVQRPNRDLPGLR